MTNLIEPFEKHLKIDKSDQTVLACLSENIPQISKQKLKRAMQYGAVWLTHSGKTVRIRRAKKILNAGDELHLYYNESTLFSEINPATLIADEIEYSVWNKPCGMFSQGTKWGDHSSIARWVELFGLKANGLSERRAFLVHRLDRATNGLVIVAHSKKAAAKLSNLFESRNIDKYYSAVVAGEYPAGEEYCHLDDSVHDKQASTLVLSIAHDKSSKQSRLTLKLETGRKHQIRKHLLGKGFAIIGDRLYGEPKVDGELQLDLQLRCFSLEFICPFSHLKKNYSIPSFD